MKSRWIFVLGVTLLLAAVVAQPLSAQQDTPAPADDSEASPRAESADGEAGKKKIKNGLYVEVGVGSNDMDPLDLSTRTSSTQSSSNSLTLADMDYARAIIGWQLPGPKGRFRVVWQSYNEAGHEFSATGREASLGVQLPSVPAIVDNLNWWQVDVVSGQLSAARTPPTWTLADDDNMDGAVQQEEVNYTGADVMYTASIAANLQNRIHTVDLLYGRTWGPRLVEGRWFGGLRYFAYEGTLLQGAWLRPPATGLGYTDGVLVRLLHPSQETTAAGPTGSMGFQFNFWDKRLQLFANGEFAFLLSQLETETGRFFTLTNGNSNDDLLFGPSQLNASRSRTSWHTHIDLGARFNSKKGLVLEVAFFKTGYLDAILTPTELRIPQSAQELARGTSAIFATQDIVMDGFRGSVGFQF